MTRRRRYGVRTQLVLLAVGLFSPALLAQWDSVGREKFASATLPESNEALLLSSRVEEAIQLGDYRLAVELIDRLTRLPGGLVAAPASRTYYPVWRQACRLLAQLPEEGVEVYRQLHDAEVSARFEEAAAASDVDGLRSLFRNYRLSSAWPAIGVELAARLLDCGAFGEAIEVLHEISLAGAGTAPEHRAQLAVALASAGAVRSAERLLTELQSDPELRAQPEWRDRLERLDRWFAAFRTDRVAPAAEQSRVFTPRIEMGAVWTQLLLPEAHASLVDEGQDIADAVDTFRRLPLQQPALAEFAGGGLVVRQRGRLWVLDAGTLTVRWSVAERLSDGAAGVFSTAALDTRLEENLRLSYDAQLLMVNHLRHAVSVGFGKVYSVEGLTLFDTDFGAFGQRPLHFTRDTLHPNELVARELNSGQLAWRTAAEPADPLYDVAFQNAPFILGDALVAPIVRGKELSLAVIDPSNGQLIREVPLVGPPNRFPDEGGRCLMVSDETTLYVGTGNGVIAALAGDDLSWRWATVYPSTLAEHLGQLWWQPQNEEEVASLDPPVIADDLLVVAPVDSDPPAIFALDRFSGRERWRMPRREYPFLIGTVRRGLVVGGRVVACLDLDDPAGRPPLWKSVPLQITGRAAICDERVYVPTRQGIVVLDGRSGKVLADQIEPSAEDSEVASAGRDAVLAPQRGTRAKLEPPSLPDRTANLLVSDDALFSVSPSRVVKYPDLCRARARYAAEPADQDAGAGTRLIRAWLEALEGRYDQALAHLQTPAFDEPPFDAARDRLLRHIFLGLARDAAGEERLAWLQRAAALAESPQSAVRLAVTIGQALEDGGRWAAALRHYGELLCQREVCYVADGADPDRRVAHWLHAAERIRTICDRAPASSTEELLRQVLRDSERDEDRLVNLQRLRVALQNQPVREQVDWLLCTQKLSPELKVQYLPKVDAAWPLGLRRRLHLERWDTHVSLGLLDQARADRSVWHAQFANTETPGASESRPAGFEPLSPEEERERVDGVDLAFRKLAQADGQPFTPRIARQWKIERAELLLDSRRPLTAARPWILVADLGNRRIALINAYKHEHPQRQTEDGLIGGRVGADASLAAYGQVAEGRGLGWQRGRQSTWPVITYQQLTAVPVKGGLVCVGLGPERYGGRRQWECAVPQWDDVPADFADRSVAGPQGVFFTSRCDRVGLVGWFDGQLRWQRDLPGRAIQRLYLSEEQLVIVDQDQSIWVTDAASGTALEQCHPRVTSPRRIDVVGDTIVVWGLESVAGIATRTLQPIWTQPCRPADDSVTVPQRPWIAYRARGEDEWRLLDVRQGQPVFEASLGAFDSISAIVADGDRLFVAGHARRLGEDGEMGVTRLHAIDLADGTRCWSHESGSWVAINATQLAAHPDYIPILLARSDGRHDASDRVGLPAIQLVSKRDGEPRDPFPIAEDYRAAAEPTCEMYLLATPTRMIVQVSGNLIAYGNSPLRPGS